MDSATLAEKISRDPLFNPKTMGLRTAEVRALRSTSPVPPTSLNFRHDGHSVSMGRGTGHMYRSSINISTVPQQQPLREHNKRFSASAMALHSNHMYSSPKASPTSGLRFPQPMQDRSRSLKNLASATSCKSLDRDDRAMLNWLSGVVGYKIADYSMLYDGTVLCQLINTIKSNTIDIDHYRDRSPAEKLQIAFYSMKEYLNINGPPAHIESIIAGNEDDLLFTYLQKIKLFYCTVYTASTSSYGSTNSLNRSHSLGAADKKHPLEYRTQTSSPYPALHSNSSCTNLESINENKVMEKVTKQRPHSYHELSTVHHLTSSSGARVIAVESGSSSEAEDDQIESGIHDDEVSATGSDVTHTTATSKVPSNFSLSSSCPSAPITSILKHSLVAVSDTSNPASCDITSVESSSNASEDTRSRVSVGSLDGRRQSVGSVDDRGQSTENVSDRKQSANVTPAVTPSRHQVPPLPNKAPPPLPPGTRRSLMGAMESTDSQLSLQSYLNQVKKENDEPCEACIEASSEVTNLRRGRELVVEFMKKTFESEKRKRLKLERKYKRAVTFAQRTVRHYEKCMDELSDKISSLTTEVQSHHKTTDSRLSELAEELSATKDEITNVVPMTPPVPSVVHDITHSPTESRDDATQSRKTFRLFRKTSKKKIGREKGDMKVTQSTSLKSFPQKEYFDHVESLNIFLQKLGYTHLLEKFMAQDIGLKELVFMDEAHLADIGIPMGPRLRILHELQTLSVLV